VALPRRHTDFLVAGDFRGHGVRGANTDLVYAISAAEGRLVWQTDLGGPVFSSPAVDTERVYIGSSDGRLYALDRATGAVAWTIEIGARIWTSPSVANGRIFFGAHDGAIYAFSG
jgi:outer membrane protein assembly factor BamB